MTLDYIKGMLTDSAPQQATVEANGLGYRLQMPANSFAQLPQIGHVVTLFVCLIVREDSHRLFGFLSRKERNFFETLNEISGVGPKLALSLLGHMSLEDLAVAIQQGNAKVLSSIPGVGAKTAQRLLIELKDKVKDLASGAVSGPAADAISTLMNLGHNALDAQRAVQKILESSPEIPSLPELISLALKQAPRRK